MAKVRNGYISGETLMSRKDQISGNKYMGQWKTLGRMAGEPEEERFFQKDGAILGISGKNRSLPCGRKDSWVGGYGL